MSWALASEAKKSSYRQLKYKILIGHIIFRVTFYDSDIKLIFSLITYVAALMYLNILSTFKRPAILNLSRF